MAHPSIVDACTSLPIFPLPRVVLLPGEVLPLHVFEPRYRALVAALTETPWAPDRALLDDHDDATLPPTRLFGIATLTDREDTVPGQGSRGIDPIYREIGVGALVRCEPHPDGRSDILVLGLARASVVEEIAGDEPFRRVRASVREDDHAGLGEAVRRLRQVLNSFWPAEATSIPDLELARRAVERLASTPALRRACLAEDRVARRVDLVLAPLLERLVELHAGPPADA